MLCNENSESDVIKERKREVLRKKQQVKSLIISTSGHSNL